MTDSRIFYEKVILEDKARAVEAAAAWGETNAPEGGKLAYHEETSYVPMVTLDLAVELPISELVRRIVLQKKGRKPSPSDISGERESNLTKSDALALDSEKSAKDREREAFEMLSNIDELIPEAMELLNHEFS